ncbi:MAG: hypothetical protein U0361_20680 [Nitrospiraceae bacterium]
MMQGFRSIVFTVGWIIGLIIVSGCVHSHDELALTSYDRSADQGKLAEFYSQEAAKLRQMSEALTYRVTVYERLFVRLRLGSGHSALAQSYAEAAREQERQAHIHSALVWGGTAQQ